MTVVCIFVPSYGAKNCPPVFESSSEVTYSKAKARYNTANRAKNRAYTAHESARVAYEKAHNSLLEKAVYERAVDHATNLRLALLGNKGDHRKTTFATYKSAEGLKNTTQTAYFTALSALPEKEVFDKTTVTLNQNLEAYESARVAYEEAHNSLPEKAVYERAVDHATNLRLVLLGNRKTTFADLQVAEGLKKTTQTAYFTALSALSEKEVFDKTTVILNQNLEAHESVRVAYEEARARSSLPEKLALEEARVTYGQSHENLPERKVRDQAWEVYLNAERNYYRVISALPQLSALKAARAALVFTNASLKKAVSDLEKAEHFRWSRRDDYYEARKAHERAYNNHSEAEATYESARVAYEKIYDSLPAKAVYEQAWEGYLKALVVYYRANKRIVLPVRATLRKARAISKKRNFEELLSSELLEADQILGIGRRTIRLDN